MAQQVNLMMMKPRIAIFQPHEDTYTNPTLVNLFKRLATLDVDIDFYTVPATKQPPVYLQENLFQFSIYPILRIAWGTSRTEYLMMILSFFNNVRFYANIRNKKYDLVLAIDPDGLIAAYQLVKKSPSPLVYFSFEIFFKHELYGTRARKVKKWENEASKSVDCVVIQDEQRWGLLKKENGISHNNVIFVPVAPDGQSIKEKTTFLREKYDIPLKKKIVLFSQGLGTWSSVEELVKQAHTWPDDFILVVHSRNFVTDPEFLKNVNTRCDPNKARFDLEPVPFKEYLGLVNSADIGLIWRRPGNSKYTGDNIRYMGLASGTFATFMKHGLPVISNNEYSHRGIFRKHKCGVYAREFFEIKEALHTIELNYEVMRNNCFTFFEDTLSFDNYAEPLMSKIKAYLPRQG